jgi:glycosyltransferase involved in cell wall biosynthesis
MSSIREWLEVVPIVWKGLKIIKHEKIGIILVCPEIGNDILSAYIMHKISRIPLSLYFFDYYSEAQTKKIRKYLSKPIEKMAIKAATAVFVMSEALQKYYHVKYGVDTILLPHPIDSKSYNNIIRGTQRKSSNGRKKIVYTGMIYEAHYDAILNLVQAVKDMNNVEFHIYSRRSTEQLKKIGICGENIIHHGLVDQSKMPEIQTDADILFMPLAFNSPYPEIIKTASPGKLPEYLAALRPILVHAPSEAYISWYARERGWGEVVDVLDKNVLKQAIERILYDQEYEAKLIENSKKTIVDHESIAVATKLMNSLGMD